MTTPEKFDLKSMNITEDQLRKLKQALPEVFTEGLKVDFDRLRQTLGDALDTDAERFGMQWPGKSECFKIIQQPSVATLKPCEKESVNWDTTENLFIEGDNLEVLKLLQKSYYGKVKMIYIDPPYNTGKEFIYPDKYSETLQTYLAYTGQVNDEGIKFSTNTEAEGRFHSKWMNMIFPRLFLARNLLRDDGVIFISIDDNEVDNLKKICNDIFGEENFVADLIWEKRFTRNNDAKLMSSVVDHIIFYRKSDCLLNLREPRTEKTNSIYNNPDNDSRGPWTSVSYISQRTKDQRPNLSYQIKNPITGKMVGHPLNAWKYSKEQCDKHIQENRLYWGNEGGNQYPRLKRFLSELGEGIVPVNLWSYKETGTIDDGTKEVDSLIGKDLFDYPKPVSLIKRMLRMSPVGKSQDIILDFFSGSCTTAHAVLDLNKEDGGNRKFIMVQLPEPCDESSEAFKAGYKTIADIGKERIRRVIKKIQDEQKPQIGTNKHELKQAGLFENIGEDSCEFVAKQDLGFKVFKLDKSNFKIWDGEVEGDSELVHQVELAIDHIDPDSRPEDILFEILLKAGFPLTAKIAKLAVAGKTVYSIEDNALLICLDGGLDKEVITAMAKLSPARVVCLDQGFKDNDQLKTNAVQIMKSHGVENFRTV